MKLILSIILSFTLSISFAQVKTGIEILKKQNFEILKNKRIGLITNPTGVDSNLKSTVDILNEAENVNLVALFGPEHGVRGNFSAGDKVEDNVDEKTGIKVYSLYGSKRKPNSDMLKDIDVLVYDIQDIGVRSYTYISTLGLAMEAAAENDVEVLVLDRPNPLGGKRVEGALVDKDYISFVSQYPIPYVYGLTPGEFAHYINEEGLLSNNLKCKLSVVKMQGWNRNMNYGETGLFWVPPSPHIPDWETSYYYAMSGILGEIDPSLIGVGYTLPFKVFSLPWVDADKLCDKLNAENIAGVIFRPIHYRAYYSKNEGNELHGVQVYINDYNKAELTKVQFKVAEVLYKLNSEKPVLEINPNRHAMFDKVSGSDKIRLKFSENYKYDDIKKIWEKPAKKFKKKVEKFYMYE